MGKVTEEEALKYQKEATPLAKALYASNMDYRRYVAAYYLKQNCGWDVKRESSIRFNLTPGQANTLFSEVSGFWNPNNGYVPHPLSDESHINLYYMQRCHLAMYKLSNSIKQSPQASTFLKLKELEKKIEEYNSEHWYRKINSDGAAFVDSEYSRYDISKSTLISAINMISEPDRRRYIFATEKNIRIKDLALSLKKDVKEFCEWNKFKDENLILPAGFVYFGSIKK